MKRCGIRAEWNAFDEGTGETILKGLSPEEVVEQLALGKTSFEIAAHYDCPLEVVEHLIMKIPEMVVWRDEHGGNEGENLLKLPRTGGKA